MNRSDEINEKEIVKLIEQGNVREQHGDVSGALTIYLELWDSLPEPKYHLSEDISLWLINCITGAYLNNQQYQNAKRWALEAFHCDIPEYATSEWMDLGVAHFELNEKEEAFRCFANAYQKGKHRAFQGYDAKYWEYFKRERESFNREV